MTTLLATLSVFILQSMPLICFFLFFRPICQRIYFLACLSKTPTPGTYALLLYCCPFFKKDELEKKLSKYIIPYRGEGEPKEPVCIGTEILVSPIEFDFVKESQRNEKVVLR